MYERNAIVLERYFQKIFGSTKEENLKTNFENYIQIIDIINEYKKTAEEEEEAIVKFDEIAEEIETIQKKENKLHEMNIQLENQRNKHFSDLGENPNTLGSKIKKVEEKLENNNEELKELRDRYVNAITHFAERQKERNKFARARRTAETEYRNHIDASVKTFETIDKQEIEDIQKFIHKEDEGIIEELVSVLTKNGKNERVTFYNDVLENATRERIKIAKIEAQLYINIYDKTKRILQEIENESIKLAKAEKLARDTQVKLAFLEAEKEYIVSFLDNERITAINGKKAHEKLMEEACKNFNKDILQIGNLYQLILRETTNKSTKKAYKELYNKDYLRKIEEKEKDFEEEVTNIKVNMGTVINSNYWRIEGIKNIYKVFQDEVSENFDKDLSEFRIDEPKEDVPQIVIENDEEENINEKSKLIEIDYDDDDDEAEYDDYIDDEFEDDDEDDDEIEYQEEKEEIKEDEDDFEEEIEDNVDYDNDDDVYDDDEDDEEYENEDELYDDDDDDDEYEKEDELYDNDDDEEEYYESEDDDEVDYEEVIKKEKKNKQSKNKETKKNKKEVKNKKTEKEFFEDSLDEDELTEEKIDEIIKNSRSRRKTNKAKNNKKETDNNKGIFGKLFKK